MIMVLIKKLNEGLRTTKMCKVYLTRFTKINCKVSNEYRSVLYTLIILRNQCEHNGFIRWPLANPYINDQLKNSHCLFSQNANFILNTILHGTLIFEVSMNLNAFIKRKKRELKENG